MVGAGPSPRRERVIVGIVVAVVLALAVTAGIVLLVRPSATEEPVARSVTAAERFGPTAEPSDPEASSVPIEASSVTIETPVDDIIAPVEDIERTDVDGDTTTIVITSDVLFDFDSATLTTTAKDHLKDISDKLKAANGTIQVDGYTDSSGTPAYNKDLSTRRARAVVDELKKTLPDAAFSATGHGESDPVAPNQKDGRADPEAMAKNRRVTISFD